MYTVCPEHTVDVERCISLMHIELLEVFANLCDFIFNTLVISSINCTIHQSVEFSVSGTIFLADKHHSQYIYTCTQSRGAVLALEFEG